MKEKLLETFPEFKMIKSKALREKALSVWQEALARGDWTVADLKTIPFTVHIEGCPVHIVDHIRSVTRIAIDSAKILEQHNNGAYKIDYDLLICGGLLHDVGKLLEYEKKGSGVAFSRCGKLLRHPFSGAGLAMKHGLPDEVVHMIALHAKEGQASYRCPEAVIIHHADFMNFDAIQMGAIG